MLYHPLASSSVGDTSVHIDNLSVSVDGDSEAVWEQITRLFLRVAWLGSHTTKLRLLQCSRIRSIRRHIPDAAGCELARYSPPFQVIKRRSIVFHRLANQHTQRLTNRVLFLVFLLVFFAHFRWRNIEFFRKPLDRFPPAQFFDEHDQTD